MGREALRWRPCAARQGQRQASSGRDSGKGTEGRQQAGQQPGEQSGGRQSGGQGGGSGSGGTDLQRARDDYARELQRTRESLGRLQAEQRGGQGGSTPEEHQYSLSAPGNEAFKQDFGKWESLRKDIDSALEQYEAAAVARLARTIAEGRLSGGGSERVPEAYRPAIARYFESIAKLKK